MRMNSMSARTSRTRSANTTRRSQLWNATRAGASRIRNSGEPRQFRICEHLVLGRLQVSRRLRRTGAVCLNRVPHLFMAVLDKGIELPRRAKRPHENCTLSFAQQTQILFDQPRQPAAIRGSVNAERSTGNQVFDARTQSCACAPGSHPRSFGAANAVLNGVLQLQRPYQPWGNINYNASGGIQNFDQLQLELIKRFSSGLSVQVECSWTRSLDDVPVAGG